jgi:Undecaprenyl-phosphate galactose phosphotransferase WbaP
LLNPRYQLFKRWIDIFISATLGILISPLCILIALLIKIDSRGPIFYKHARLGMKGKNITVWKFRTMTDDADQVLQSYLSNHPQAQQEWENNHKLKYDPRITRMGKMLRRTSLDEIPQLWNVLTGEMSLVGPRPIVPDEVHRYQEGYTLYQRVRPGITGLWQVSGRTDVGYSDRVRYDEYYVRNWSIWLDIYILLRTVWTVVRGEGAY